MGVRKQELELKAASPSAGDGAEQAERVLERLVSRAMRGDDDALYGLCEKIARRVLFLASHILSDPRDAEDVSQEALIHVCRTIRRLRAPEAFLSWLSKIVMNEARNHIRNNAGHGVVMNVDDYIGSIMEKDEMLLPQEYAENEEFRRLVLGLIDGLPSRQREAVLLHYYGGLGVNEIAAEMGIDHSNASRYLAMAREKLRRELERQNSAAAGLYSAAALPLGELLGDVLQKESVAYNVANPGWEPKTLDNLRQLIRLRAPVPVAATALKALFWPVMGLVSVGIVTAGVYIGAERLGPTPLTQISAAQSEAAGRIEFTGGTQQDGGLICQNPTGAVPLFENKNGEAVAIEWYITQAGGEERLYSGEGGDADDALGSLAASGKDGKYVLNVLFRDRYGGVYRVYESFLVESEP